MLQFPLSVIVLVNIFFVLSNFGLFKADNQIIETHIFTSWNIVFLFGHLMHFKLHVHFLCDHVY